MSQPLMQSSRIAMHRVVVDAICALGTGFVDASTDPKCAQDLFGELIGLTYRLICMAVMEQTNKGESLLHAVQKPQAWKELCVYMEQYGAQMNEQSARRLWSVSVFPHLLTMKCERPGNRLPGNGLRTECVRSLQRSDLRFAWRTPND